MLSKCAGDTLHSWNSILFSYLINLTVEPALGYGIDKFII